MLVIILIILIQAVSFWAIIRMKRNYRPLHFHSQNAFSVLIGIYFLFFLFTAIGSAGGLWLV